MHTLRRSADLGDVYLPQEDLVRASVDLLGVDTLPVEAGVEEAVASERVVREQDRIYTVGLHRAEVSATELLQRLLHVEEDVELPFDEQGITDLQRLREVQLAPDQVDALRLAHAHHVLVMTGGPGTGKTTLTRFLLDLFEAQGLKLVLAAPTGRAARRLAEATGREASTLHRLLGFDPATGAFGRDDSNPVEADVLLVDEASMIELRLFDTLLRAVRPRRPRRARRGRGPATLGRPRRGAARPHPVRRRADRAPHADLPAGRAQRHRP